MRSSATADVTARHIKIKQLFPQIEKMQATVGEIYGDAQLSATGDSVGALLASSNGEVKAPGRPGHGQQAAARGWA
jgi:uncharacterized protein involved in outer membrane biogenesis